ncbi:MAG TPA: hypothetical protein ENN40_09440 [Candidatus Aminicenantes bacterium]|nr:hypothetical protein [Candidatus Aminicenantes bacterium]
MNRSANGLIPNRSILLGTFFLLGFLSILFQTLFLREIMVVVLGNEIVIAIVLFHWLVGITFGSRLGGRLSDRLRNPGERLFQAMLLLTLLAPLALVAIRHLHDLTMAPAGLSLGMWRVFVATALIVIPHSLLVGMAFPLAMHIARKGDGISHMSRVYIIESLGSLAAGAMMSWVLAGRWPAFDILFAALATGGAITLWTGSRMGLRRLQWLGGAGLLLAVAGLLPQPGNALEKSTVQARWQGFSATELVTNLDSRFQNIALGRQADQYALYLNGQMATTFPDPERNHMLAARLLSQHPRPRRVLVIGEAVSGLAQAMLNTDISFLHNVELDHLVVKAVRDHLSAKMERRLQDPRFRLHLADGRRFVQQLGRYANQNLTFDLAFVHASEPVSLLANRYFTLEFLRELSRIMNPQGVVCLRVTSSDTYTSGNVGAYASVIYHTLRSVFPYVVISPGADTFFFASRRPGVVSRDPATLSARWRHITPGDPDFSFLFSAWFPAGRGLRIRAGLEARFGAKLNTDDLPTALHRYNRSLGWVHVGGVRQLLQLAEKVEPAYLLLATLLLLLPAVLRRRGLGMLYPAVSVAGFSGMSLQLLIITLIQSRFGFIYRYIGLFTALFMAGLPLGAAISRRLARRFSPHLLLSSLLCALAVVAAALERLLPAAGHHPLLDQIWISVFTILVGGLVGAVFPAALAAALAHESLRPGRATGRVNAADHSGAALGALLAGTLMLPILGMSGTNYLLAGVNLIAALYLFWRTLAAQDSAILGR